MKINKLAAAVVTAGVLTVGAAGVAVADTSTPSPTPTPPATTAKCTKAPDRLNILEARLVIVNETITLLQAREANATAHGRTAVVTRVEARLTKLGTRKDNVTARITKLEQRCNLPAPAPAA